MDPVLVLSIALRVVALVWSLLWLRRSGERCYGYLAAMFACMATRQGVTLGRHLASGSAWRVDLAEIPGLVVSLFGLLAVGFVGRMLGDLQRELSWRRATEASLRESEERGRCLIAALPDTIFRIDRDGRLCEHHDGSGLGLFQPGDRSQPLAEVGPAVAEGVARLSAEARDSGTVASLETMIATGRGQRDVEMRLVAMTDGDMVCLVRDITPRKIAERGLLESQRRLLRAQQVARLGDWEYDLERKRIEYADSMFRVLDVERASFDGTVLGAVSLVHPEDRAAVADALTQMRHGEPVSISYRVIGDDGQTRYLWGEGEPVFDPGGKVVKLVGTAQDVTERHLQAESRRELEAKVQHAQKLESLGVLAGGIAHDFNNLLVGVLGNAGLALAELPPTSPIRERLRGIERAAQQAARLTHQMLAYAGRGKFLVERLDLKQVIDNLAPLVRAGHPKSAGIVYELVDGGPQIAGDAGQIGQLVLNLVGNAIEALPDGAGTVRVVSGPVSFESAHPLTSGELPAGDYCLLEVRDDGVGMDEATRAAMFEPFFTTKFTGRGLGLAAVLGIVQGHRGGIEVDSQPGRGTAVRVYLPIAPTEVVRTATPAVATATAVHSGTVLVVDDEEAVRGVAQMSLERAGFQVVTAADGAAALEIFRQSFATLRAVVLDLTMPVMGGEEALAEMRKIDEGVPVVITSGYDESDLGATGGGRFDAFLQKPFRPSELVDKVRGVLSAARLD